MRKILMFFILLLYALVFNDCTNVSCNALDAGGFSNGNAYEIYTGTGRTHPMSFWPTSKASLIKARNKGTDVSDKIKRSKF